MSQTEKRPAVIYVTGGWGVHDLRWVDALEACHFAVVECHDPHEVADLVIEHSAVAVLAGPLFTVTQQIGRLAVPLFGLSWGFDLNEELPNLPGSSDTTWLQELSGLIVDSQVTREIAVSLGVSPARMWVIPWGVDLELFTPNGPTISAVDHGFDNRSRVVLSLRTHDDLYRTSDVIEAFVLAAVGAPDIVLVMGGSGPLTSAHEARISELGLSARFRMLGQIPEADLPAYLRGCDAYLTASQSDGTSVTMLQAMACGAPIIASANTGNAQWITDGLNGDTFPVGDIDALAALLVICGRNPKTLSAAERAHELVTSRANWAKNRLMLRTILAPLESPSASGQRGL
jgi:glycosyltransferase involved in cell wall biosynthesis